MQEAIERLKEALAIDGGQNVAQEWLFLAPAHYPVPRVPCLVGHTSSGRGFIAPTRALSLAASVRARFDGPKSPT